MGDECICMHELPLILHEVRLSAFFGRESGPGNAINEKRGICGPLYYQQTMKPPTPISLTQMPCHEMKLLMN